MDRWEELSFLLREQSSVQCPTRIRECRHRSIRRYVRLSLCPKRVTQLNSARVIVALNEDNNSDSRGGGPVERCNHCELREAGSSSSRYNRHALAFPLAPPPSLGWVVDGCVQVSSKAHGRGCETDFCPHCGISAGNLIVTFSRNLLQVADRSPCLYRGGRWQFWAGRMRARTLPPFFSERTLIA